MKIEMLPLDGKLRLFCMASGDLFIGPSVKPEPMTHQERLAMVKSGHVDEPWGNPKYTVTHWMELPDPPIAETGFGVAG